MRSLAKKAEYSARLSEKHALTVQQTKSTRITLEHILSVAVTARSLLQKVPDHQDVSHLVTKADATILKATNILHDYFQQQQLDQSDDLHQERTTDQQQHLDASL